MRPALSDASFFALAIAAIVAIAGCRQGPPTAAPDAESLLPLLQPDADGLLLTWIDDKGDFHVETRISDVPVANRDAVRVVDPTRETPTTDQIFVGDFRELGSNGTYPMHIIARADFEGIAVTRRARSGPTMASAAPFAPAAGSAQSSGPPSASADPSARVVVVIYGAEWCGACHEAARYLRQRGIPYVEKDIEKDGAAAQEMERKLAKHGLRGGSIPVIDVRGTILVGFDPESIDTALHGAL